MSSSFFGLLLAAQWSRPLPVTRLTGATRCAHRHQTRLRFGVRRSTERGTQVIAAVWSWRRSGAVRNASASTRPVLGQRECPPSWRRKRAFLLGNQDLQNTAELVAKLQFGPEHLQSWRAISVLTGSCVRSNPQRTLERRSRSRPSPLSWGPYSSADAEPTLRMGGFRDATSASELGAFRPCFASLTTYFGAAHEPFSSRGTPVSCAKRPPTEQAAWTFSRSRQTGFV
jgi:hypothetical protein